MQKSIKTCGALALVLLLAVACSTADPLEASVVPVSTPAAAKQADQAIVADKVGQADTGVAPLAWANPSTGSAGVIEQVSAEANGSDCRSFVTTQHTIDGLTAKVAGMACPTGDAHWKLNTAAE